MQNKSLVIGWNPPDNFSHGKIEAFRVVVDGGVRSVVGASETRATVSGAAPSININKPN